MTKLFAQRYETHKTINGFKFTFYCDLCDDSVMTVEYQTDSFEMALSDAQKYAKRFFNMCHHCGRWICDEHYNEDNMQCIECSPKRERRPPHISILTNKICPICGRNNANGDCFCHHCGKEI